jgi:hypothetical protein
MALAMLSAPSSPCSGIDQGERRETRVGRRRRRRRR